MPLLRCAVPSAKIEPTARITVASKAIRKTRIFVPPLGTTKHGVRNIAAIMDAGPDLSSA
jgi:hypothetical protein